jgi:hypothetical protein
MESMMLVVSNILGVTISLKDLYPIIIQDLFGQLFFLNIIIKPQNPLPIFMGLGFDAIV